MDDQNLCIDTLELIAAPCFCVKDGVICGRNGAARKLPLGDCVEPLLAAGGEAYADFSGGSLYLTLSVEGTLFGAAVERRNGLDFFLLEEAEGNPELRALSLAARELRQPLSGLFATVQQLDSSQAAQIGALNRGLSQMLRLIGNMSAAASPVSHPELTDITAVFREIFMKAQPLLERLGLELHYEGPEHSIYSLADAQELERGVLNLLSNAAKFSPGGSVIRCSLTRQSRILRLCIQDEGSGIPDDVRGSVFNRYLRQPAIEDGRQGLGLGLVLVRACAGHHGGAVLIDHPAQGGTRVTVTLAIRQDTGNTLRSPRIRIDYAGERDHALVELSDVLPAELYGSL